jgi:hypothetical protein
VEPAEVFDGREVCDVPDAEPAVTDGAPAADVTAPTALDGDGGPLGVEMECPSTGGVFTVGVLIGGTVTVGVLSVGVLSVGVVTLGVLTVGVVTGPTVIGGTVTEGTLTVGTDTVGTDTVGSETVGSDTVGSGGRTEEVDGSVSRDAPAVLRAAELPRATAVDNPAPASRAAHAARAVSRRRVIYPHPWSRETLTVVRACHVSPHDLSTSASTSHTGPPTRPERRTTELTTPPPARRR